MSKKLSYLKCKLLSKITVGKTKEHYKSKKRKLKQQIIQKKFSFLFNPLDHALNELKNYQAYQKYYLIFKQRYDINIPADVCGAGNFFELIYIPLKSIVGIYPDGSLKPLTSFGPYQYLKTRNQKMYLDHLDLMKHYRLMSKNGQTWSLKRFQDLEKKITKEGYQPEKSAIVINQHHLLYDGLHRTSILLYLYGGDYEIPVIQVSQR